MMHKGHSLLLLLWVRLDGHVCNVIFVQNADVVQNAAGNNNAWDLSCVTHLHILQLTESSFEQPERHFNHNARARVPVVEVTLVCSEVTIVAVWWQQPVESRVGAVADQSLVGAEQMPHVLLGLVVQW